MTSEAQRVGSQKRFGTRHPGPETPNRIKRRTSTPGGGRELQATAIGNQPRRPRPPLCARVIAGAEARVVEERGAGGRTGSEADGDRERGWRRSFYSESDSASRAASDAYWAGGGGGGGGVAFEGPGSEGWGAGAGAGGGVVEEAEAVSAWEIITVRLENM